ncbi:unnamed protein product, partial [Rotaria sordida]
CLIGMPTAIIFENIAIGLNETCVSTTIVSVPFITINLYRSLTIQINRTEDQENIVQFIRLMAI